MRHSLSFISYSKFLIGTLSLFLILSALTFTACSQKQAITQPPVDPNAPLRDNTPVCLIPTADGVTTFQNEYATVDISNAGEGYIMACYTGSCDAVKLQIVGPDYMTYTYDLLTDYDVFPLSAGSGSYTIGVYENVSGNQYATVLSETTEVTITNEMGAFLYPNQYVAFTKDSAVVAKAQELSEQTYNELGVITNVYNYVISNITYDYEKAENVQSGYIPAVDDILASGTGICLDYAAVMTSMLRSQQIPTRLEVGYAGDVYHAWISTYIPDQGWVNGIIQFDGTTWELMDPTFAANESEKKLKSFIGDGSNYLAKYIY